MERVIIFDTIHCEGKIVGPMLKLERTNSGHPDFIKLVALLDAELAERDGPDNAFYSQFNKIDKIRHAVVAFEGSTAVGCGAMKERSSGIMEVKRMFTSPGFRGRKIASRALFELERWATELGCDKCVLETGKRQPEAIALYEKLGYKRIPNFGPYAGVENSVCFEKALGEH